MSWKYGVTLEKYRTGDPRDDVDLYAARIVGERADSGEAWWGEDPIRFEAESPEHLVWMLECALAAAIKAVDDPESVIMITTPA